MGCKRIGGKGRPRPGGWKDELSNSPYATEGKILRAIERDLVQRAGAPGRGRQGVPADAWADAAAGEPPFSRGQALPDCSPDFNADEAVWGWVKEEATGNLCLGIRALVQQRVNNFLAGLASRKDDVKRRCQTVLQSRAEALLRDSQPDSWHAQQMYIPPWLWFRAHQHAMGSRSRSIQGRHRHRTTDARPAT